MPRELTVRTPENVEITHSLAGIGSRFVAILLDHLFQSLVALIALLIMALFIGGVTEWMDWLDDTTNLSGWVIAVFIFFYFLLFWGYFILFETIWNGQTPGKRLLRIRVVKENGSPIDFFSVAIRNIVRVIDMMPTGYGIGVITMFFSPAYKRVGDYAAGTVVVKEYRAPGDETEKQGTEKEISPDLITAEPDLASYLAPETEDIPGVTIPAIRRVTREEYDAARRYLDRREELPEGVGASFSRRIAEPILNRLDMTPEDPDIYPYELFLETLAKDYLRWQDVRF